MTRTTSRTLSRRLLIAVALVAGTLVAEAQQMPPGKWWRRAEVVQELQLSRDQQDRLDAIFQGAANDLIDAKASVEKLQVAIRGELDRSQVRRDELRRVASQLTEARGRLFERELIMLVDMRAVLDEGQWRRMRTRLDRAPAKPRERPQQRRQPRR